jgi:hypothetical protein
MITLGVEWGPVGTWAGAIATVLVVITTALVALGYFDGFRGPRLRLTFVATEPWCRQGKTEGTARPCGSGSGSRTWAPARLRRWGGEAAAQVMPDRSPTAAAPVAPTQVRQAAARCGDRDAHMNTCRFPVVRFGSVSPRWRSGNSAHGQKDAGLAFTAEASTALARRRRMFMIVGRAAAGQQLQPHEATRDTTRHNNGFRVMPCDARLRRARPVGVSRWHARGQGFKSPQLHPRSAALSAIDRPPIPTLAQ